MQVNILIKGYFSKLWLISEYIHAEFKHFVTCERSKMHSKNESLIQDRSSFSMHPSARDWLMIGWFDLESAFYNIQ